MNRKITNTTLSVIIIGYFLIAYITLHSIPICKNLKFENIEPEKILSLVSDSIKLDPLNIDINQDNIQIVLVVLFMYTLALMYYYTSGKNLMLGKEYGTARWGNKSESKKLIHKEKRKNIIFTKSESMSLDTRKIQKNLNALIIGGSGSGKSRFYVKPNLMQCARINDSK